MIWVAPATVPVIEIVCWVRGSEQVTPSCGVDATPPMPRHWAAAGPAHSSPRRASQNERRILPSLVRDRDARHVAARNRVGRRVIHLVPTIQHDECRDGTAGIRGNTDSIGKS